MPPRGVKKGTKLARQYEHIKDSERKQGAFETRAKEIAARTVNKERARSGESRTALAHVDARHVVEPPRRSALRHEPPEGPHQGAALQRGQADEHRGPLEDEQGPAPARRRPQEDRCR